MASCFLPDAVGRAACRADRQTVLPSPLAKLVQAVIGPGILRTTGRRNLPRQVPLVIRIRAATECTRNAANQPGNADDYYSR